MSWAWLYIVQRRTRKSYMGPLAARREKTARVYVRSVCGPPEASAISFVSRGRCLCGTMAIIATGGHTRAPLLCARRRTYIWSAQSHPRDDASRGSSESGSRRGQMASDYHMGPVVPRASVVTQDGQYLHAEFSSALMGSWTCRVPAGARADGDSRALGGSACYSDLGVNRKRVESRAPRNSRLTFRISRRRRVEPVNAGGRA